MNSLRAKRSLSLDVCQKLVGRKEELEKITDFVIDNVKSEKSGCLYVSGGPGTGKTATMKRALQIIEADVDINLVCINCMELQSANDLYKTLHSKFNYAARQRSNVKLSLNQIKSNLENFIRKSPKMIVLCLDEVDQLTTTDKNVLYTIFSWPSLPDSRLILIGIANALDLTQRDLPKIHLQFANKPKLLPFRPYTKEEIVDILKFRLCSVDDVVDTAAIEICARKVSANDGDVRKALQSYKLTMDKNENGDVVDENRQVKPMEIVETIRQVYGNRMSLCSSSLTLQQKLVLASILKFIASKSKSFTVDQLFGTYKEACFLVKIPSVDSSEVNYICQILESFGLIRKSKKNQKFSNYQLNVDESTARSTLNDEVLLSSVLN